MFKSTLKMGHTFVLYATRKFLRCGSFLHFLSDFSVKMEECLSDFSVKMEECRHMASQFFHRCVGGDLPKTTQ